MGKDLKGNFVQKKNVYEVTSTASPIDITHKSRIDVNLHIYRMEGLPWKWWKVINSCFKSRRGLYILRH